MLDWLKWALFGVVSSTSNLYHGQMNGHGISSLVISNKVVDPDGFKRSAVLAGGVHPGPIISGHKGDRFRINVINALTNSTMLRTTSIHWHGIFQEGSSWADGVSFVTQCPITPNTSFLYDYRVPDQAGTFWYHSHDSTQYCDGLRGPLIVYDPHDPHRSLYDVDDESTIISLADWYHSPAPVFRDQAPPISNSTLINGKGRYPGGPSVPLAVISVQKGRRYRLRIISMSCYPNYMFSIDGHPLQVIEADGENTRPHTVDSIQIFAGQRYSAILHANQPADNYWIRSEPDPLRGPTGFEGGINSAILRYSNAPSRDPTTLPYDQPRLLKESDLHPLYNPRAPGNPWLGGADVSISLFHAFDILKAQYTLNGVSWTNPTVPVLLQILSGSHTAQELLPKGSVYSLPPNKVVEISLPGSGEGMHPFHLHGHSFSVVRSAGSNEYNYESPMRRDTVSVGVGSLGDNVTVRFTTDNSGPWFLHCHIDWHLDLGLAIVFAEDAHGISKGRAPPVAWDQLCPDNFIP